MRYLTGVTNDNDEPSLIAAGIGLMLAPETGYVGRAHRYPFVAADNGCFALRGRPFNEDRWRRWLDRVPRDGCLFAVAPDVLEWPDGPDGEPRGNAMATLELADRYLPLLRAEGFPGALVLQDGVNADDVPWNALDAVFVGGSTVWKFSDSVRGLVAEARKRGKWAHMGRVNSLGRMKRARSVGCISADGTFIRFRRRSLPDEHKSERERRGASEVARWATWLATNQTLPGFTLTDLPTLDVHQRAFGEVSL